MDERIWQQNTVFCALPDFTGNQNDPLIPTPELERHHASRPGIARRHVIWSRPTAIAARFPSFRTEFDGRVCFKGDLVKIVALAAAMGPQHGSDARPSPKTGGDILTLSEPWDPPAGHAATAARAALDPGRQALWPGRFRASSMTARFAAGENPV